MRWRAALFRPKRCIRVNNAAGLNELRTHSWRTLMPLVASTRGVGDDGKAGLARQSVVQQAVHAGRRAREHCRALLWTKTLCQFLELVPEHGVRA